MIDDRLNREPVNTGAASDDHREEEQSREELLRRLQSDQDHDRPEEQGRYYPGDREYYPSYVRAGTR